MVSRPVSTLISGLVFVMAMVAPGSARAQFGLEDVPCIPYPIFSEFDVGFGYGTAAAILPVGYGSFGVMGYDGSGEMGSLPSSGYGRSIGQRPRITRARGRISRARRILHRQR